MKNPEDYIRTLSLQPHSEGGWYRETFSAVVPAGCWFGASVDVPEGFALVKCTVAPGFDFSDLEMGVRSDLNGRYSRHRALIERLTRG